MNLFTNCVKYNKPGGSIHMQMHMLERTDAKITCQFIIEDTGLGMSEDFIKNHLFNPFEQADESPRSSYMGTGLGMSIVHQLIEQMGGTISVESKLGEGSRFTIVLPFELDRDATAAASPQTQSDIAGTRLSLPRITSSTWRLRSSCCTTAVCRPCRCRTAGRRLQASGTPTGQL